MKKGTKLKTIEKLFEGKEIRTIWDSDKEEYYFSVVDVIYALTDTNYQKSRNYWKWLKNKLNSEGSELVSATNQLKMKAQDGKMRLTDVLDTEGIFRLIQSIPSPKAEPFKLWLAKLGRERVDETFDPSIALQRAIDLYRVKGYDEAWIAKRIKVLQDRKQLTDAWHEGGITKEIEYAMLTNEIYKTWSGMTAGEYKQFKGIRKENLRDNMAGIELSLTDLSEEATKLIAQKEKPQGLKENIKIASVGGNVAKIARDALEEKLGKSIVTKDNKLDYEYVDEKLLENKK